MTWWKLKKALTLQRHLQENCRCQQWLLTYGASTQWQVALGSHHLGQIHKNERLISPHQVSTNSLHLCGFDQPISCLMPSVGWTVFYNIGSHHGSSSRTSWLVLGKFCVTTRMYTLEVRAFFVHSIEYLTSKRSCRSPWTSLLHIL